MGEASLTRIHILSLPPTDVEVMFKRRFPSATLIELDGNYTALTVHGVGCSPTQAMEASLIDWVEMEQNGRDLPQMLQDVLDDFNAMGYSKERHDWAIEILEICKKALSDGQITNIINPIEVPGLNRKIEDYIRRADTKLRMMAVNLQQEQEARKRAGVKAGPRPPEGLTEYQRMKWKAQEARNGSKR